ncbi:MAG: hypothetical protein CL916_05130 [Deltaproteobacteria bacterium]|nr:hypothetical protein [Deltaproteobacteria bacterium]
MVWSGVVHRGHVALDTPWLVINNPILAQGSYNQLGIIFTDLSLGTRQTLGAEYLPIRDVSVLLDFAIFGKNLAGHHLHNLILYLASCCILLSCSMTLFGRDRIVWLMILLYTLMPVHVENVAWLASRKDVLSLFWGMLAVWTYLRSSRPILWATLYCVLAYLSKNTSVVIPVILVALSIVHKKEDWLRSSWWIQWIPLVMVHGLMLFNTMEVGSQMGMLTEHRATTALGVLSITAQVWWHYLCSMLVPTSLSAYYIEPIAQWNLSAIAGFGLIILGVMAPIFYRMKAFVLGLIWIFWGLLPVSQIVPIQNLIADRYLLFPSIGFVWILLYFLQRTNFRWMIWMGVVFFGLQTYKRIPIWHGSIPFWMDLTKNQPTLVQGWVGLAGQYTKQGKWNQSETVLREGQQKVSKAKDHAQIHQGLGLLAYRQNEYSQAELMLELAIHEDSTLRKAQNNLVQVYRKLDKKEKAYETSKRLCTEHPLYDVGWNTLGVLEMERGDLQAAQEAFLRSLEIRPVSISVWVNMGNVAFLAKDYHIAQYWWQRVLLEDSSHAHAQNGLKEIKRLESMNP